MRPTIFWILFFLLMPGDLVFGQNLYSVKKRDNIYASPVSKARVVGKLSAGDTIRATYLNPQWFCFTGVDGQVKYIKARNLMFVSGPPAPVPVQSASFETSLSWTFSDLLQATFYFFIVLAGLVALILFIIHYLF